jgi:hypothetical protein
VVVVEVAIVVVVVVVVVIVVVVVVAAVVINYKSRLCDCLTSLAFCSNFVFSDTQNFRNKKALCYVMASVSKSRRR